MSAAPESTQHTAQLRLAARVLGYAGLIPFIALGLASWMAPTTALTAVVVVQAQYAAAVLAFLGALHWGTVLARPEGEVERPWLLLGWGVLLPLWAWRMTWASSWVYGTTGLFLGIAVAYGVDVLLRHLQRWPAWFLQLRLWLTLGALFGLGLTLTRLYLLHPPA